MGKLSKFLCEIDTTDINVMRRCDQLQIDYTFSIRERKLKIFSFVVTFKRYFYFLNFRDVKISLKNHLGFEFTSQFIVPVHSLFYSRKNISYFMFLPRLVRLSRNYVSDESILVPIRHSFPRAIFKQATLLYRSSKTSFSFLASKIPLYCGYSTRSIQFFK